MIVTVTANPSIDRTYDIGTLSPGELHRATQIWTEASGKGVNVSRLLQRLGIATKAVIAVDNQETAFVTLLEDLPFEAVAAHQPVRTNVTLLTGDTEPTKINESGRTLGPHQCEAITATVDSILSSGGDWLLYSGSLPGNTDPDFIAQLAATGRAHQVPVAVDTAGPALAAAVEAGADLLAPNGHELSALTQLPANTIDEAVPAAGQLQARTGGDILITLGAQGAVLLTPHGSWRATPPQLQPRNTTGAGDALLAGYLAASTLAPAKRLAHAVSIGSSACLAADTTGLPETLVDSADVHVADIVVPSPGTPTGGEA